MLSLCAYILGVEIPNWCLWLFPTLWTPPREDELPTNRDIKFSFHSSWGRSYTSDKIQNSLYLLRGLLQAGINFYKFSSVRNPYRTDHTQACRRGHAAGEESSINFLLNSAPFRSQLEKCERDEISAWWRRTCSLSACAISSGTVRKISIKIVCLISGPLMRLLSGGMVWMASRWQCLRENNLVRRDKTDWHLIIVKFRFDYALWHLKSNFAMMCW